jgi:hypothetical protein
MAYRERGADENHEHEFFSEVRAAGPDPRW